VQIHGFASREFVYTNTNKWLTMNSNQGSAAITDVGVDASSLNDKLRAKRSFTTADWINRFYGNFTEGRFRIDSEYPRYSRNLEIFNGTSESFADVRGWYVSRAYRICERLQIGS
jgi:hypothetical protein